ncbi:hypothetical protein SDC9_77454 [bioreactor metagenome]|uniref:RES domain-containing protein n=1 Tax=bioreactor metagenome TaxID=1076179 RepID=A0A644YSQ9_9ZZZZ
MGYWKNKLLEWDQRGYGSIGTVVCHGCFGDYAIKEYIKRHGKRQKCDYCHNIRKSHSLEEVIGLIVESAYAEYEDANGCMGYESKEGGFIGANTFDAYDFIHDELNQEMEIENEDLLNDITNTISDSITWCEYNPYGLRLHEYDYQEWEKFTNEVKKTPSKKIMSYDILKKISLYIEELDLIVQSGKGCGFYRSRGHTKLETYSSAKSLGAPPTDSATANRFSKCGESMFYGAEDIDTTLEEIADQKYEAVTTAKFYPTRSLLLLDLTKIKKIKWISLFDERRELRSPLIFLREFQKAIAQPVNGVIEEYLPTQMFSTYLRTIFKTATGACLDGIIYESSRIANKKCYALFFNNDDMVENKSNKFNKLWVDKSTIKRM